MKRFTTYLYMLLVIAMTACSDDIASEEKVRPSIDCDHFEMYVGETATAIVSGSNDFEIIVDKSDVVQASASGGNILLTAMKAGDAVITLKFSAAVSLRIFVSVKAQEHNGLSDTELADKSMRLQCDELGLSMRYESTGVMFLSKSSQEFEVHDLIANRHAFLNIGDNSFTIDGESIELSRIVVEKTDDTCIWYSLTEATQGHVYVFVCEKDML